MTKLVTFIATTAAALMFVFCVLAVIAAADELALAPFYYTLPVTAVVVNATWLLFLLRKRGRVRVSRWRPFTRFASRSSFSRGPGWNAPPPRPAAGPADRRASNAGQRGSPQEMRAALDKVHSVVLGYPRKKPTVMNQKEHANDEAHR